MGGPMSVHDDREHPWMTREKTLIGDALKAGKGILGICLGGRSFSPVFSELAFTVRERRRLAGSRFDCDRRRGTAGNRRLARLVHPVPLARRNLRPSFRCNTPRRNRCLPEPGVRRCRAGNRHTVSSGNNASDSVHREFVGGCRADLDDGEFVQLEEEILGSDARFSASESPSSDFWIECDKQ